MVTLIWSSNGWFTSIQQWQLSPPHSSWEAEGRLTLLVSFYLKE